MDDGIRYRWHSLIIRLSDDGKTSFISSHQCSKIGNHIEWCEFISICDLQCLGQRSESIITEPQSLCCTQEVISSKSLKIGLRFGLPAWHLKDDSLPEKDTNYNIEGNLACSKFMLPGLRDIHDVLIDSRRIVQRRVSPLALIQRSKADYTFGNIDSRFY